MDMENRQKKPKICIIGGTGEFGRLFARFFKTDGLEVLVTGRNRDKGEKVSRDLGVGFTNDNISAAKASDIVVICVPIENTVEVIKEVAPNVRSGSLLMDFTSVKVEPVKAMEKHAPRDAEVLGSHPMFGPRVTGLEGQTVILTKVRSGKWTDFFEKFLERRKARVFTSTPEEHDRVMAIVQGLTHFAYITCASTIKKMEIDVEKSRNFASPVYELMLDFIARIVGQDPSLYASIQMHNPFVEEVHETFIKEAERLGGAVKKRDMAAFVQTMSSSARIFKDVDSSMGKSDKAISALSEELKKLKESLGKEVALRHIYSRRVHFGSVVSVDPDSVVIDNKGKKLRLKLSNIELLDDDSLLSLKKELTGVEERDFSYIFPDKVEEQVIIEVVRNSNKLITGCQVIDLFKGEQIPRGKKSITLRVWALEKKAFKGVESLLMGLGGSIR